MNSVALLLGLLLVAFVGSQLMSGRTSGYRLASGSEYLLLGLALGPYALGVAQRSTSHAFQPIAAFGAAWLTLVIGTDYGFVEGRRVSGRGLVAGIVLALVSSAAIAAVVYVVLGHVAGFDEGERRLVAGGIGLAGADTTRHAVRWIVGRHAANGPLAQLVGDVAEGDDLVPLLGAATLYPFIHPPKTTLALPWVAFFAATIVIGVVLGVTAAALLRAESRASNGWGVLIGASLLATGVSQRLGLSALAATFALGLTLSRVSRHGAELRRLLAKSEPAVLLPILLLSGTEVQVHEPRVLALVVLVAFGARLLVRLGSAPILSKMAGAPAGVAPSLGAGLLPSGALSVAIGLAVASRFPGKASDMVLATTVALALLGEAIGPGSLRRALVRAKEIEPEAAAATDAEPSPEASP